MVVESKLNVFTGWKLIHSFVDSWGGCIWVLLDTFGAMPYATKETYLGWIKHNDTIPEIARHLLKEARTLASAVLNGVHSARVKAASLGICGVLNSSAPVLCVTIGVDRQMWISEGGEVRFLAGWRVGGLGAIQVQAPGASTFIVSTAPFNISVLKKQTR